MEINIMSWTRVAAISALSLMLGQAAFAAPWRCPASLTPHGDSHRLNNASLFDGPPGEMADLIPIPSGAYDRWDVRNADPYLVCKYAGTDKIITLHAQGAARCQAGGQPFQAVCEK